MTESNLAHDLLLLMVNLAQLRDRDRTRGLFVESLNQLDLDIAFRLVADDEPQPLHTLEIATSRNQFGHIAYEAGSPAAANAVLPVIRNGVSILAVILENQLRAVRLSDENIRLEAAVMARTQELAASNANLQNEIEERRKAETQLVAQERIAAVGQMAAGLAHDFNNYLASIVLYAQLGMQESGLGERHRRRMGIIYDQAQQAARLVQQLLDFARQAMLWREPRDLAELLSSQEPVLERILPDGVEMVVQAIGHPHLVRADSGRIEQVVRNIVENACDFMPNGGTVTLTLRCIEVGGEEGLDIPELSSGTWEELTIVDTGLGIAREHLPHIFEPFFTTRSPEHSGLGLSQAYGIVAQHAGYMDVESELGKGTAVHVYLPAIPVHEAAGLGQTAADPGLPQGNGERVLVVDDNVTVRTAIKESLAALGYDVDEAGTARQALEILRGSNRGFHLVLSDVALPGMTGVELFHILNRECPALPVILISGHPLAEKGKSLVNDGLAGWLDKPPGIDRLATAVAVALDR